LSCDPTADRFLFGLLAPLFARREAGAMTAKRAALAPATGIDIVSKGLVEHKTEH
jgi:hypothetical protein